MVSALRATVAAAWVLAAAAKSILEFPLEVRQRNVVRVSHVACEECATLDDFYKGNSIVFLLFYERALVGKHHYKQSIISAFHSACEDLRWSHVVCGAVDMVEDKAYAQQYIDPKTAPAHILARDGTPIQMQKRHIDKLMAQPGDKAAIMWHLRDLLTSDPSPGALDITTEVSGSEPFARLLRGYQLVIAGTADRDDQDARDAFRAAAQRLVLAGDVPKALEPPTGAKKSKSAASKEKKRIAFVLALGGKALTGGNLTKGTVAAFVSGQKLDERQLVLKDAKEADVAEALRSLAGPGLKAAEEAAKRAEEGRVKPRKKIKKGIQSTKEL